MGVGGLPVWGDTVLAAESRLCQIGARKGGVMDHNDGFDHVDISGDIGPMIIDHPKCPMYSFNRPTYAFWNGFARGLMRKGFTKDQIIECLQSRDMRHYLDQVDDIIEDMGTELAERMEYEPVGK